jgi:hypothetical protein
MSDFRARWSDPRTVNFSARGSADGFNLWGHQFHSAKAGNDAERAYRGCESELIVLRPRARPEGLCLRLTKTSIDVAHPEATRPVRRTASKQVGEETNPTTLVAGILRKFTQDMNRRCVTRRGTPNGGTVSCSVGKLTVYDPFWGYRNLAQ